MAAPAKITPELDALIKERVRGGETKPQVVLWLASEHGVYVSAQAIGKRVKGIAPSESRTLKVPTIHPKHAEKVAKVTAQPSPRARADNLVRSRIGSKVVLPSSTTMTAEEERVRRIADMILAGEWKPYPDTAKQRRELSVSWGVSEETIRRSAAEAHRLLAMDPDERDALKATIAQNLLGIAIEARSMQNQITGLPDFSSSIKAYDVAAKFAGIEFEQKIQVKGIVAIDDLEDLRKRIMGDVAD